MTVSTLATPVAAPVPAVLAALRGGARSVTEIARTTGLARDTVATAVDHLAGAGRVETQLLRSGCPDPTSRLSCADCLSCA